MTGIKISAQIDGGTIQSTDELPVARSGTPRRVVIGNYVQNLIDAAELIESVTGNIVNNTDPLNPVVIQVQADWTQLDSGAPDCINNKPGIGTLASQDADDVDIFGGRVDDVVIVNSLLNGLNIHETIYAIAIAPNNPATGASADGQLTDMGSGGYTFNATITNDLATDISNITAALAIWGFLGIYYTIDTAPNGHLRIKNNQTSGNRNFGLSAAFENYGYLSYFVAPNYQYSNNPIAGDILVYDGTAYVPAAPGSTMVTWQMDDLSDDVDGVNVEFTLSETPVENSVFIFNNTAFRVLNIDYTISGDIITFDVAPADGTILTAQYMVA